MLNSPSPSMVRKLHGRRPALVNVTNDGVILCSWLYHALVEATATQSLGPNVSLVCVEVWKINSSKSR